MKHFAIVSWQHSQGALDVQTSLTARYSSLTFVPDPLGDLLFDGIAQDAFKQNVAYACNPTQPTSLDDAHTLRGGVFCRAISSKSLTTSQVIALDDAGNQISDMPLAIIDNGAKTEWIESLYLQDEWKLIPALTLNYGLRFDHFTRIHRGPSGRARASMWCGRRWMTPWCMPAIRAISRRRRSNWWARETIAQVRQHHRGARGDCIADTPHAGTGQLLRCRRAAEALATGSPSGSTRYYKQSHNLIDEGQFGAPIILTPFNYAHGKQYGAELTGNFSAEAFTAYLNLACQSAKGKDIDIGAVQLLAGRSRLHRQPLHSSGSRAASHRFGRRVVYLDAHHAQRRLSGRVRLCGRTRIAGWQLHPQRRSPALLHPAESRRQPHLPFQRSQHADGAVGSDQRVRS